MAAKTARPMTATRTAKLPNTSPAKFKPPAKACDSHAHVYGPYEKFPLAATRNSTPAEMTAAAYTKMHEILGFDRGVLTQPSQYGVDNSCLIDALEKSNGTVKGIVTVDLDALTDN